jgi:hypothetical protein
MSELWPWVVHVEGGTRCTISLGCASTGNDLELGETIWYNLREYTSMDDHSGTDITWIAGASTK